MPLTQRTYSLIVLRVRCTGNENASERSGDNPTCARRGDEAVVEATAARGGGGKLLTQRSNC